MVALDGVWSIHGKKISTAAFDYWVQQVFSGHDYQLCLDSVNHCGKTCSRAPKPDDVCAEISRRENITGTVESDYLGSSEATKAALDSTVTEPAAINIADAWKFYHALIGLGNFNTSSRSSKKEGGDFAIDLKLKTKMTKEEALIIVNQQAAKWTRPEAIEPEYRIKSYFDADVIWSLEKSEFNDLYKKITRTKDRLMALGGNLVNSVASSRLKAEVQGYSERIKYYSVHLEAMK